MCNIKVSRNRCFKIINTYWWGRYVDPTWVTNDSTWWARGSSITLMNNYGKYDTGNVDDDNSDYGGYIINNNNNYFINPFLTFYLYPMTLKEKRYKLLMTCLFLVYNICVTEISYPLPTHKRTFLEVSHLANFKSLEALSCQLLIDLVVKNKWRGQLSMMFVIRQKITTKYLYKISSGNQFPILYQINNGLRQ